MARNNQTMATFPLQTGAGYPETRLVSCHSNQLDFMSGVGIGPGGANNLTIDFQPVIAYYLELYPSAASFADHFAFFRSFVKGPIDWPDLGNENHWWFSVVRMSSGCHRCFPTVLGSNDAFPPAWVGQVAPQCALGTSSNGAPLSSDCSDRSKLFVIIGLSAALFVSMILIIRLWLVPAGRTKADDDIYRAMN